MWSLKLHKKNIKVFTKPHPTSSFDCYRAEMESPLPMSYYVSLFKDIDNYKNWMHTTIISECVEDISDFEKVIYMCNRNFPIKDRDYYARIAFSQDPETLQIDANWKLETQYPAKKNRVRLNSLDVNMRMIPSSDRKKMKLEFEGHFEPEGLVPDWLANAFITEVPYKTLLNASKQVKKKKYQTPVTFIEDYNPI